MPFSIILISGKIFLHHQFSFHERIKIPNPKLKGFLIIDMLFPLKSYEKKYFTVYEKFFFLSKVIPLWLSLFAYPRFSRCIFSFVLHDHIWAFKSASDLYGNTMSICGRGERKKCKQTQSTRDGGMQIGIHVFFL